MLQHHTRCVSRKPFGTSSAVNVGRGKVVTHSQTSKPDLSISQISRRDLGGLVGVATLLSAFPAVADGEVAAPPAAPQQQPYIDAEDAFRLQLPANWQSTEVGAQNALSWFVYACCCCRSLLCMD